MNHPFLSDLLAVLNPVEWWSALTYRSGPRAARGSGRMSVDFAGARRRDVDEDFDLVMFDVDRKTGRVRVAAARRAKEER